MSRICSKELVYSLVLMLGALSFGYIMGYPALALLSMEEKLGIDPSSTASTFFNSITALVAIAGPFVVALLLKYIGRRFATFIIASFCSVSWCFMLLITKKLFWVGIIIRGLLGLSIGAFSSLIPMYIVELAPKDMSGSFGSLNQLGIALGFVVVYLIGNCFDWLITAVVGIFFSALLAMLIWFIPESPASLFSPIIDNYESSTEKPSIFKRKYFKSLFVCVMLMVFQQFCGINAILTNIGTLFTKIGVDLELGIASAISAMAQVISVFVVSFLIDRLGRKVCWGLSFGGIVISLVVYAISLKVNTPNWLPVVTVFFYLLSFGLGAGPIPWFIVAEIFEADVRPAAQSIVSSSNWLMAFTLVSAFPKMQDAMSDFYCFIFFLAIAFVGMIFGVVLIPGKKKVDGLSQSPMIKDVNEYMD